MMLPGIDVSAYQTHIDWQRVAASGVRFAFIKATEGTGWRSPEWAKQWEGASGAGLLRGPYHFGRWEHDAPIAEARQFRRVVGELAPGDLSPVLDLEWIKGQRRPADQVSVWAQTFLAETEQLFQRTPILYLGPSFWRFHVRPGQGSELLTRYPLWIVDYRQAAKPEDLVAKSAPTPMHGADWEWDFWQWTGSGRTPGVTDARGKAVSCDRNLFRGSIDELRLFAGCA